MTHPPGSSSRSLIILGFSILAFLLFPAESSKGQSTTTDAMTPLAIAPGSPAGSYPLSELETINPYNGGMNFRLPLYTVVGRGGVSHTMRLNIDMGWRVERHIISGAVYPTGNWWHGFQTGYGPGVMVGRKSAEFCTAPPLMGETKEANTRITFTSADGTEYEFRDNQHQGAPKTFNCYPAADGFASRGTVFWTTDGEAATFVSDNTISDIACLGGPCLFYPTGYMSLRDGMRYRIETGKVMWIRDRNGNKLVFAYDANNRVTSITDSLNRVVTIQYDQALGGSFGNGDVITYKGYGGAARSIRITKASMSTALRSGYSSQTYQQLFPRIKYALVADV